MPNGVLVTKGTKEKLKLHTDPLKKYIILAEN